MRLLDLTKEAGKVGSSRSIWGAVRQRDEVQAYSCSQAAFAPPPQVLSPPCLCTCCSLCPSLLSEVYSASSCPWVPPWSPPKQARSSHCKLSRYQVPVSFSARVPEELSFDVCDGVLVYLSALQGLLPAPAQGQAQTKHRTNSKQSGKGDTYRHQYDQVQW